MLRCHWCNTDNPAYVYYHDHIWGTPEHSDQKLFEMLVLESFQAGLSWECILNRKEQFEKAFDYFDAEKVSCYDDRKIEALMQDAGIIRNCRKITATIANARVFLNIQKEFGSFDSYIWGWTEGKVLYENGMSHSELSDKISLDLKKRGMKFVGTTIIYSYLQATGVIYSHEPECYLYRKEDL